MKTKVFKLIILLITILFFSSPVFASKTIIGILPFSNLMKDTSLDWLSGGIAETLVTKLVNVQAITLVERVNIDAVLKEIAFQQSGFVDEKTAAKAGNLLGAQVIVIGAFQKVDENIRLTSRFVEVETGKVLGGVEETGKYKDIFSLQDKIALKMLNTVKIALSKEEETKITNNPTSSITAYEYYSKGIEDLNNEKIDNAKAMLEKAVAEDKNFTLAKQTLDYVQWIRPNLQSSIYLRRVSKNFKITYQAMINAAKNVKGFSLVNEDLKTGIIKIKQKLNMWSVGQDITVEIKPLDNFSGIQIISKTKKTFLGGTQKFDWGESKRSIKKLIEAFEKELLKL